MRTMPFANFEGKFVTPEQFRHLAGADYQSRKIYPACPDCEAQVTLVNDNALPFDSNPRSLFPHAANSVTTHFRHFQDQADPNCRYYNPSHDTRIIDLTSGVERSEDEWSKARQKFVSQDGRITHAGYWAGYLMAGILGEKLDSTPDFFSTAQQMVVTDLIPPASSKVWHRKVPAWARPFTWLAFHDFSMKGTNGIYDIQYKIEVPHNSVMDASGHWHGSPGYLAKQFKSSGENVTNPRTHEPVRYVVTEENAWKFARFAANREDSERPFRDIPKDVLLAKLNSQKLFPDMPLIR